MISTLSIEILASKKQRTNLSDKPVMILLTTLHLFIYVRPFHYFQYLTNKGGTFGRASVPQRFINQALYYETLLLETFNGIRGKVSNPPQKSASNLRKKLGQFRSKCQFHLDLGLENWQFTLKVFVSTSKM